MRESNDIKLYSRKAVIGDFRCQKVRQHSDGKAVRISQADETWFMGSHLAVEKVLILTYTFAHKFSYEQAINECNISDSDTTISRETVSNWYSYCREICVIALDREYANQGKIGGDGHLVEIDEMNAIAAESSKAVGFLGSSTEIPKTSGWKFVQPTKETKRRFSN